MDSRQSRPRISLGTMAPSQEYETDAGGTSQQFHGADSAAAKETGLVVRLGLLGLVGVALAAAACSGSQSHISQKSSPVRPQQPPVSHPPLTVDKAGLSGATSFGGQFWSAGAVITNHDKHAVAFQVVVAASAYDAHGQVVGTGRQNLIALKSGQTLPVAVRLQVTAPPARVTVLAAPGSWSQPGVKAVPGGLVGAEAVSPGAMTGGSVSNIRRDSTGTQMTINGTLTNTYDSDFQDVAIEALGLDQAGNIVWVGEGAAPLVPAHGQVGFQVVDYGQPANVASWLIAGFPTH